MTSVPKSLFHVQIVLCIGPTHWVSYFCRYLAHGSTLRIIAKSYRISDSIAGRIVRQTCIALRQVLQPLYLPEPTTADWRRIAFEFEDLCNFPNCIGAIDGKHIKIEAPANSGTMFHNCMGGFSTVLLAVCDARYRFIKVDIGECGSRGDAGLFNSCELGKEFRAGSWSIPEPRLLPGTSVELPYVIVGDEAFPLSSNLMRPFPGASLNSERRIFNYRLCRARRIIENAFGILANRWRILRQEIRASTKTVDAIVWATVLLHNYLRTLDDEEDTIFQYCSPADVDRVGEDGRVIDGEWRADERTGPGFTPVRRCSSNNYGAQAKAVREKFMQYFLSQAGRVSWQDKVLDAGIVLPK